MFQHQSQIIEGQALSQYETHAMKHDHWALLSTVDDFRVELLQAINTVKEPICSKYWSVGFEHVLQKCKPECHIALSNLKVS